MATSGEGVSEEIIDLVTIKAASKWKDLARKLPIASPLSVMAEAIKHIEKAHPGDIKEQCTDMLTQWSTGNPNATVVRLVECLRKVGQGRLAQETAVTVSHGQNTENRDQGNTGTSVERDNISDTATQHGNVASGTSGTPQRNVMTYGGLFTIASNRTNEAEFSFGHNEYMYSINEANQGVEYQWEKFHLLVDCFIKLKNGTTNNFPITVAVIDSGLFENHDIFKGKEAKRENVCEYEENYAKDDNIGHGTACAGIISYFTQKVVRILNIPIKITEDKQKFNADLKKCLEYLQRNKDVDIVSISIVSTEWSDEINELIGELMKTKVVISAAGNDGNVEPDTIRAIGGIRVGSCNRLGHRSDFSSKGDSLFCLAPGELVPSARSTTLHDYKLFEGTSFACPFVAAVAANILARALTLAANQEQSTVVRGLLRKSVMMATILKKMCVPPDNGLKGAGPLPDEQSGWTRTEGYGLLNRWDMLDTQKNNQLQTEIETLHSRNQPQPS